MDGIVFPHIENKEQAEFAAQLLGSGKRGVWPSDPNGDVVGYFMIEDRDAVRNAASILSTSGVGIAAPGQGSLTQAFNNDAKAVEAAVQTIVGVCRTAKIVCAKLANASDVGSRIEQGFRVLIASGDALTIGRKAAGR